MTYNFVVHSNDMACRKRVRLGLDPVYYYLKNGTGGILPGILIFRRCIVRHLWYFIFLESHPHLFWKNWGSVTIDTSKLYCWYYLLVYSTHYTIPIILENCLSWVDFLGVSLGTRNISFPLCCVSVSTALAACISVTYFEIYWLLIFGFVLLPFNYFPLAPPGVSMFLCNLTTCHIYHWSPKSNRNLYFIDPLSKWLYLLVSFWEEHHISDSRPIILSRKSNRSWSCYFTTSSKRGI